MRCVVPQSFATRGNQSYPDLWVVTSDLRCLGYKTPTAMKQKVNCARNEKLQVRK
jgi:hypothetical protein